MDARAGLSAAGAGGAKRPPRVRAAALLQQSCGAGGAERLGDSAGDRHAVGHRAGALHERERRGVRRAADAARGVGAVGEGEPELAVPPPAASRCCSDFESLRSDCCRDFSQECAAESTVPFRSVARWTFARSACILRFQTHFRVATALHLDRILQRIQRLWGLRSNRCCFLIF